MRLSTMILPVQRWAQGGRDRWLRAEELGFHAAYTYDHLAWRGFRDKPWFGTIPTLAAAATVTRQLKLGPLVTSPNFRHPVPLAKELMSLDDLSGGRMTLGIGAGAGGFDAMVLGTDGWGQRERADRFAEFLGLLDQLLREEVVSSDGVFYSAREARTIPGCVQQPRLPFCVAGTGPRGLALAARYGAAWVTMGDPRLAEGTPEESFQAVAAQIEGLNKACAAEERDASGLDKVLMTGFTPDRPLESVDAFVDFAGRYRSLGITEIVIHWPIANSVFIGNERIFERIATDGIKQLE